jgi:hypothetical protein
VGSPVRGGHRRPHDVRIAYIIHAHTLPDQLVRLVEALHSPRSSFYIHFDRKSPDAQHRHVVSGLAHLSDVHHMPRRRVHWGGFGSVQATLTAIDAALAARPAVDVAVLLSGQDYPIRPTHAVEDALARVAVRCHLQHTLLPDASFPDESARYERWHFARPRFAFPPRRLPLPAPRRFPAGYRPHRGSAFWGLSRAGMELVRSTCRDDPRFVRFFRYVFIPDEMFFQSLLMSSPLAPTVVDDDLHFTDWTARGSHPATLGPDHLEAMAAATAPFARKFDERVHPGFLDAVDARLRDTSTPRERRPG